MTAMNATGEKVIEYVMTTGGPEPLDNIQHPPDREHYVAKQIRPVAEPVLSTLGLDFDTVIGAGVVGEQFFKRGADARFHFVIIGGAGSQNLALHELDHVIQCDGRFGSVNNGFELGF